MQAARGASLSSSGSRSDDPAAPHPRRTRLFLVVAVLMWAVDQGTKVLAVEKLSDRAPVPLVGDLLQLTLLRNPGAAFSTGTTFTLGLSVVAVVATVVVLWFGVRARTPLWAAGLGLLLAGVTGNLTDRVFREPSPFRGHVVDFLMLPHWPVFNVADVCINVAAVVIVVQALRGVRLDGGRTPSDRSS